MNTNELKSLPTDELYELRLAVQAELFSREGDPLLIEAAREQYGSSEIEIDDQAMTSHGDGGIWVAAWLWIEDEEADDEGEEG